MASRRRKSASTHETSHEALEEDVSTPDEPSGAQDAMEEPPEASASPLSPASSGGAVTRIRNARAGAIVVRLPGRRIEFPGGHTVELDPRTFTVVRLARAALFAPGYLEVVE